MRYFIEFAYNGTNYHGWQYQPNAITVQETLNKVFSILLQQEIAIVGAGRTDTGVHATQMYGHFDTQNTIDTQKIQHKANSFLPKDIVVFSIFLVSPESHARFDATSRTYNYHITTTKDIFSNDLSWYYPHKLDIQTMNYAASLLLDFTDFECFSKSNTDVFTYNCKITNAIWQQQDNKLIFTITADRFLRNMVRAIVGTLINVGLHKITVSDFISIIESKSRKKAGFSVPAQGLFLTQITYPYINKSQ